MFKSLGNIPERLDALIRVFFYILAFWLPYAPAVIESCLIASVILWVIKRLIMHGPVICRDPRRLFAAFRPPASVLNRPIYFFLLACIVSVIFSPLRAQALSGFITKTMEWFAIFWLIQESFTRKKQIALLLGILLFSAAATAVNGLVQYHWLGKDIFRGYPVMGGRATASFKAPASLGAFMAAMIPMALSLFFINMRSSFKWALWPAMGMMVWTLMLTFTRGAWVGSFAGVLVFSFIYLAHVRRAIVVRAFLLGLALLLLAVALPLAFNREATINMLGRSNTATWRLNVWRDSMKMVKEKPLFGHGVNTYMALFQQYRWNRHHSPIYAHNCYLQVAVETGLLGLAAFLWIFARFSLDSLRAFKAGVGAHQDMTMLSMGLFAGIAGFMAHSFFDTNLYSLQLSALLWFLVGVQIKINRPIIGVNPEPGSAVHGKTDP